MGIASDFVLDEIRLARTSRGLSQDDFGKMISYSASHVSSVETGQRPPTEPYMLAIDAAFETGGSFERMLEKLAKLDATPVWLREWIEIEREATCLRWYEPAFVPGLLQTEGYARATLLSGGLLTAEEVEQRVQSRMDRQAILRRSNPPQLVVVIDEAVLRRTVDGERAMMREQVEALAASIELPQVSIHVVPSDVGIYPGLAGSFILASLPDGGAAAHLDNQVHAQIVDRAEDIATLSKTWESIRGEALPRRQTLDLIKEAVKTWT
jgi:transcriptional regulator with XRE-family HTH domain